MAKDQPMINPYIFMISGTLLISLISGIKYLVGDVMSLLGYILIFLYGGFVGHLAMSKHTSLLKNFSFFSIIGLIVWTYLSPIQSIGGNTIIRNVEFWTLILLGIIFFEREVLNSIQRVREKPQHMYPAFIGSIAILVLFSVTGLNEYVGELFRRFWWLLLVWFGFLYIILGKNMKRISKSIVKRLEG